MPINSICDQLIEELQKDVPYISIDQTTNSNVVNIDILVYLSEGNSATLVFDPEKAPESAIEQHYLQFKPEILFRKATLLITQEAVEHIQHIQYTSEVSEFFLELTTDNTKKKSKKRSRASYADGIPSGGGLYEKEVNLRLKAFS